MTKKVAVTGGNGFIGKKVVEQLRDSGHFVVSLQRSSVTSQGIETRYFDLSDLTTITTELLKDVDVVIHLAALVHNKKANQKLHKSLNFEATKRLFEVSDQLGVEKFIFASTVGVYGINCAETAVSFLTKTSPSSPYAKAKLDSEIFLLSSLSSTKVSVFRLPLVYGRGAPGNYGSLEKLAKTILPLPFKNINNRRSMVSVGAVAKALTIAATTKTKYTGLQQLAEEYPFSTKELIIKIRADNGMSPKLFLVPKILIKIIFLSIGKRQTYEKLYEDLEFISTI